MFPKYLRLHAHHPVARGFFVPTLMTLLHSRQQAAQAGKAQ